MKKINCKSDFDFILRLRDCKGDEIGWPEFDWHARLWTTQKANSIAVSCTKGEPTNCFNDNGSIHIVMNNHRLGAGVLNIEFTAILPNSDYPDDNERIVTPLPLEIELIRAAAPCPESFEIEAVLPVVKGKPFTYDDFTPEQIAELRRPATEAADAVNTLAADERRAEAVRVAAEEKRVKAETLRASAETARAVNERQRVADERARVEAEDERREAEKTRAAEFAGFGDAIDSKADRSELSNIYGVTPLDPGNFPELEQFTRERLKQDLFIDMWCRAWGQYGGYDHAATDGKPYLGNGLRMTYEEAVDVWNVSQGLMTARNTGTLTGLFQGNRVVRTVLPVLHSTNASYSSTFADCVNMETVRLAGSNIGDLYRTFSGCTKLRAIYGELRCFALNGANALKETFHRCGALEHVEFFGLARDINLSGCPRLSLASVRSLLAKYETARSTATVHPDVYSKLTDESNEEWHAVIVQAAEKNITFATT